MMKKKGTALATVLIVCSVLIILGTAVSVGVINSGRLNKMYSEEIDLELAAQSGLNIVLDDFFTKIKNGNSIDSYVVDKTYIDSIYNEESRIEVKITLNKSAEGIVIVSTAENRKNGERSKEASQTIKINNVGGETEEDEVGTSGNAQNILNVKQNVIWGYSNDLNFIKNMAFGGSLLSNQWNLNDYIANNNIANNEDVKVDYQLNNENLNKEFGIKEFEKKQMNFENLDVVTREHINNKEVESKNYIIYDNVNIDNYITLKNTTLIIDGNLNTDGSKGSFKLELDNSNLIIKGNVDLKQFSEIVIKNNSFVDVLGSVICKNGNLNIDIRTGSTMNINDSLTQSSQSIDLNIVDNSILDIENGVESNNTINMNIENSKFIVRNGHVDAKNNPARIKGENCEILFKGALKGNTVNINLLNSRINTNGMSSAEMDNNLNIDLTLNNSKVLCDGEIKANYLNNNSINSDVVFKGSIKVTSRITSIIENSVYIINGSANVEMENMDSTLKNSAMYILNSSSTERAVLVKNSFTVNNMDKSYMYVLGDLEAGSINIYGSSDITPTDNIKNKVDLILKK